MDEFGRYIHFRLRRTRSRSRVNTSYSHSPAVIMCPSRPGRYRSGDAAENVEYDAFCNCWKDRFTVKECTCGEMGKILEWVWDVDTKSNCTHLVNNNKDVRFHLHFSGGTAVIKGNRAMTSNQHFWEVKMTSLVYGTDMMVGIGTKDADVQKVSDTFCSVLGIDSETWGLSYTGLFHHQGLARPFSSGFGQGTIIGVHLDMWNGTLSFYKNRQFLGIACKGLKGKTLYPMVSSTAARSGMRIIHSVSFPTSLQFLCCVVLRKAVSPDMSVFEAVEMPPGMEVYLANNLGWLLGERNHGIVQPSFKDFAMWHALPQCIDERQTCLHEHLTCQDCHSPVFAGNTRIMDENLVDMPSHFMPLGPVLLQRCRFRPSAAATTPPPVEEAPSSSSVATDALPSTSSGENSSERDGRHDGSEVKKRRYTSS